MRAGDQVRDRTTGQVLTVAFVDGDEVWYFGWPQVPAKVVNCEIIRRASDDEYAHHATVAAKVFPSSARGYGHGSRIAYLESRIASLESRLG